MIKLTILLKRNPQQSHEDFLWFYKNEHARLFSSLPVVQNEVLQYDQFHALPVAMPGLPEPSFDGTAELWFRDAQAMFRVFTSDEYIKMIRPSEKQFLQLSECSVLISVHHRII
ncbi:EthD domain-containing protein [Mucilaginibacter jinjuensis]|uniref:EthD domain-containing protein n=1 Tax=Mucilaginibacter jinjuensis TaxID=1176721 RepID=A0ABY7TAF6_9SPHI|nr:EthD domain-containing protein [Mucilaginibacter jinjuensis]WCT13484.1 EthD domain-containing protein [Mucilaginibacter jinjuensis]